MSHSSARAQSIMSPCCIAESTIRSNELVVKGLETREGDIIASGDGTFCGLYPSESVHVFAMPCYTIRKLVHVTI